MRRGPCPPNCPERRPGTKTRPSCHSDCPRYQAFWDERREENRKNLNAQQADQMKISAIMKAKRLARLMKGRKT